MAESYKQVNKTVGNKTVLEEGYYYLNNFNHILSSFGEDQFQYFLFSSVHKLIFPFSGSSFLKHVLFSAVTLFELTVVNNWYITMVRPAGLALRRSSGWPVGGAVDLLLCVLPDRKESLL